MSKFIFVRHGQSEANARTEIAQDDSPLTEQGRVEARQTAQSLREQHIDYIICSPMPRARETAEIIAEALGVQAPVQEIDQLREKHLGDLMGKHRDYEPEQYFLMEQEHGVESRGDLLARMQQAFDQIRPLAEQHSLLVVGHSVSGYYLRQAAAGKRTAGELDPPTHMQNASFIEVNI